MAQASYEMDRIGEERREFNRWRERVEEATGALMRQAAHLQELAMELTPKAQLFLRQKLAALQAFLAVQWLGHSGGAAGPCVRRAVGVASGTTVERSVLSRMPLPQGYAWMPISTIDQGEIPANMSYNKAPFEVISSGFRTLQEKALPALDENPSRGLDYFIDMDKAAGQSYPGETAKVYEYFF